jgi:hypothetical protein
MAPPTAAATRAPTGAPPPPPLLLPDDNAADSGAAALVPGLPPAGTRDGLLTPGVTTPVSPGLVPPAGLTSTVGWERVGEDSGGAAAKPVGPSERAPVAVGGWLAPPAPVAAGGWPAPPNGTRGTGAACGANGEGGVTGGSIVGAAGATGGVVGAAGVPTGGAGCDDGAPAWRQPASISETSTCQWTLRNARKRIAVG